MKDKINKIFKKWFRKEYNDSWEAYLEDGEESHSPIEIKQSYTAGYKQSLDTVGEKLHKLFAGDPDVQKAVKAELSKLGE